MRKAYDIEFWPPHVDTHTYREREGDREREVRREGGREGEREGGLGLRENGTSSFQRIVK